jgi:DNA-binding winged helix-turn-helix (wHTH) protein
MTLRFGDIRVDAHARQLWRGAEIVHLPRKAFDLLLLLLEHRPDAISKEQIHARLWPGTYVSEASLQALISEIRQAIGDDGRRRAIVRTIHGVGYAFTADVIESDAPRPAAPEKVLAWLIGELGRIPLRLGENLLGRGGEEVTEIDDTTVSRRHARLTLRHSDALLEDLDSKNGTWLRDERVTGTVVVADGDVVRFGSARFTFRIAGNEGSTASLPERDNTPSASQTRSSPRCEATVPFLSGIYEPAFWHAHRIRRAWLAAKSGEVFEPKLHDTPTEIALLISWPFRPATCRP